MALARYNKIRFDEGQKKKLKNQNIHSPSQAGCDSGPIALLMIGGLVLVQDAGNLVERPNLNHFTSPSFPPDFRLSLRPWSFF